MNDFLAEVFPHSEPFGPTSAELFDPTIEHELKALGQIFTVEEAVANRLALKPKVLFGRRGSGKTSALMHSISGVDYAIIVYAQQQMWRGVYNIAKSRFEKDDGPSIEEASDIWREVFRSLVLEAWVRKILTAGLSESVPDSLRKFVDAFKIGSDQNRPGMWRARLRNVSIIFDAIFQTDTMKAADAAVNMALDLRQLPIGLWPLFEAHLRDENIKCAIRLNSSEQYDFGENPVLISGLLHFIAAPELDASGAVDFQIALPTEHIQSFEQLSASPLADFSNRIFLQWSCEGLVQLAARRCSTFFRLTSGADTPSEVSPDNLVSWVKLLESAIGAGFIEDIQEAKISRLQYVLRHIQLIPRQLLSLLNNLCDGHTIKIEKEISDDHLRRTVMQTSTLICSEIFQAYRRRWNLARPICEAILPDLPKVFDFSDLDGLVNPEQLHARVRRNRHQEGRQSSGNEGNKNTDPKGVPQPGQTDAISSSGEKKTWQDSQDIPYELNSIMVRDMLVEIGAVGRVRTQHKDTDISPIEVSGDFDYTQPSRLFLRRSDKMCIHPVFSLQYNCPNPDNTRVMVWDAEVAKFFQALAVLRAKV